MRHLAALCLLAACAPEVPDGEDPTPYAAAWEGAAGALVLRRDGEELLRIPRAGFVVGRVEALDDTRSYDPVFADAADVRFVPARAASVDEDGTVRLDHGEGVVTLLTITEVAEGRFELRWTPEADGPPVAMLRVRLTVDADEGFYGGGEVFDRPEHRGRSLAMQLEVDGARESVANERNVPVPLLVGTRGWGVLLADDHPSLFDVATEAADVVQITAGTGMDTADGVRIDLYAAHHPLDVTRRYYDATGNPALPAPWALGPMVWRDENTGQQQVLDDMTTMRALDLAASGMWIDRPYASGIGTFDFRADTYEDPAAMIAAVHDLGLRMGLWHVPYVDPEESPEVAAIALAGGWYPPSHPPVLNNWGVCLDFTNPVAFEGWQDLVRTYTDMGIEGFKLDYAQDVVVGVLGGRLPWSFHDGSDERTMHKQYTRLYHQVYAELLPPEQGFLLNRAGTWGDQVFTPIVWPGDIDARLIAWDDEIEGKKAVGGLAAAVVAAQSLGPSGYPFFGSDTGGYRHSPPDKETFTRWFQHTALSAVMQIGTSTNDLAWEPTPENGFDAEMLGWYRGYVRLHQRLFPYLWTYAKRLEVDGRPIVRPLGLAWPELGVHPPYDYLLGDHLLVAPVVVAGATTRELTVPPGRWVDWFTGEVVEEGVVTVDAPLHKLPLFLREGGIVPLLRPTIDTLAPVGDPDAIDSFATDPGVLWARVVPGQGEDFELYDGAVLGVAPTRLSSADGAVFDQGVTWEILGLDEVPDAFELDGAPLPAEDGPSPAPAWWEEDGIVFVAVPPGTHTVGW